MKKVYITCYYLINTISYYKLVNSFLLDYHDEESFADSYLLHLLHIS